MEMKKFSNSSYETSITVTAKVEIDIVGKLLHTNIPHRHRNKDS